MARVELPRRNDAFCATLLLVFMVSAPAYAVGEAGTTTVVVPSNFSVSPEQQAFLDKLEHDTFAFFWDTTPADTGLTPDRLSQTGVSSIAAVGFALTSYTVAADRGWITREQAATRTLATLQLLWRAHQGPEPRATSGYKGLLPLRRHQDGAEVAGIGVVHRGHRAAHGRGLVVAGLLHAEGGGRDVHPSSG